MGNFMYDKRVLLFVIGMCLAGALCAGVIAVARRGDSAVEGEQATGFFRTPVPQPGDPWVGIILDGGDVILEKGTYLEYPDHSSPIEVMRLTHAGFIVVGERKIHIDTLAAIIEQLAIVHGEAVTE